MDLKIKYEKGFIKPDKDSLILLGIILVLAILVGIGLFYYFKKQPEITIQELPKDRIKEILKTLGTSAPGVEGREISEEELDNLGGADEDGRDIDKDILKTLGTVPE